MTAAFVAVFAIDIASADDAPHLRAYTLLNEGRFVEARALLERLERKNDAGGLEVLGYMHFDGIGVAKDEALGAEYFRRSAELGDTTSMAVYGRLRVLGRGVRQDTDAGLDWMRDAAALDDALAHVRLGDLHYYPDDPIPFDLDEAVRWFTSAHRLGHPDAARPLGEIRLFADQLWDRPDLLDCAAGEDLLREAIVLNDDGLASLGLGWAYYDGLTCEAAPQEAMQFFKLAEGYGAEGAALALGIAYAEDVAAPRDRLAAVRWLALALERGEEDARPWLDWTIAGLDPPLGPEELADIRGLQILFDGGDYALPEGRPARPVAPD